MSLGDRVILMGTAAPFSNAVLDRLLAHGLRPVALALPEYPPAELPALGDTPVETGHSPSRFQTTAERLGVPLIYLPESARPGQLKEISQLKADFILVACWPYRIGSEIRSAASKAAINLHPSLLPNYRGPDPVGEQLAQQEEHLGVSLHLLNDNFDRGDLLSQAGLEIGTRRPGRELIEAQAARVGSNLFMQVIADYGGPDWRPRAQ